MGYRAWVLCLVVVVSCGAWSWSQESSRRSRPQTSVLENTPSFSDEQTGEPDLASQIPTGDNVAGDEGTFETISPPTRGATSMHAPCSSCQGAGCDACGHGGGLGGGRGGFSRGFYARGEYLVWWTDGLWAPALASTSTFGTPQADAGVMGIPTTRVIYGNEGLNSDGRSGGRITMGYWFDNCRSSAIEGDFFYLSDATEHFVRSSDGRPILARPFYDINNGTENAELVAFPGVISGTITVDALTRFRGAGLRRRWNICGCDSCDPCNGNSCFTDFTLGYRILKLDDSISIREDLTSQIAAIPDLFVVNDQFKTWNTFNGVEFGTVYSRQQGPVSIEMINRISIGSTHSRVQINGFTDNTPIAGGATVRSQGGLLAQSTNIGSYERDALAVAPELQLNFGYQINRNWKFLVGYNFLYLSNVLRAGQQIDRDINRTLIPVFQRVAPAAVTGPLRPDFQFNDTDFWAMGINLGAEARW